MSPKEMKQAPLMPGTDADSVTAPPASRPTREPLHSRNIKMDGFRRSDGLFEVEARLTDTKPFNFRPVSDDKVINAGDLIHNMAVHIVFDEDLRVHDVIAFTDAAPYADCHDGPQTLKTLIGLRMVGGWSSEIRKRLSGAASCVHLAGLMVPMATAAHQALGGWRLREAGGHQAMDKPISLNTCLAYASHGQIVRRHWPEHYIPIQVTPAGGDADAAA